MGESRVESSIYETRFSQMREGFDIRVSCSAVFRGEEIVSLLQKKVSWLPDCIHVNTKPRNPETPPSIKFYLIPQDDEVVEGVGLVDFSESLEMLLAQLKSLGVPLGRFEWLFQKISDTRAFCCRLSEVKNAKLADARLPLWGFGRAHTSSVKFRQTNPTLAGPIVDFHPDAELPPNIPSPWSFEPVCIGVASPRHSPSMLRCETKWSESSLILSCDDCPVSEAPELFQNAWASAFSRA